jgi:hypothetical protein
MVCSLEDSYGVMLQLMLRGKESTLFPTIQ